MTGELPPRGTLARSRAGSILVCLVLGVSGVTASGSTAYGASGASLGTLDAPAGKAFTCAAPAPGPAFRTVSKAPTVHGITDLQLSRLSVLASAGQARHLPARAQAIALMTALADMDESMSPERLGTMSASTEPAAFYRELRATTDWQTLPPSIVGHRIFQTPDPYVFEGYWDRALGLLAQISGKSSLQVNQAVAPGAEAAEECRSNGRDSRGFPLPAGTGYEEIGLAPEVGTAIGTVIGTEFDQTVAAAKGAPALIAAPCGTPVLSATSGTVHIKSGDRDAGAWLLEVHNDASGETTSYAHVGRPSVTDGKLVLVGEQLATVGDLGRVAGCALGFGVVKGDDELSRPQAVNWLRATQQAPVVTEREKQRRRHRAEPSIDPAPTTFRMASFNVLGSHLTGPGSSRPHFGPGPIRMSQALTKIESLQASVVVFNEFESPAANVVLANPAWRLFRATGNNVFRDGNSAGNAIAWRDDTWALVSATEFPVPWQVTLHMPVVTLRNRVTGGEVVVVGVHNPASTSRQGNQSGSRGLARNVERTQIADIMEQTGLPVILAGDMNERVEALCGFTADSLLTTFTGGASTCAGYGYGGVDFIFGGGDLEFADRVIDRSTLGQVSDHPLVTSAIVLNP